MANNNHQDKRYAGRRSGRERRILSNLDYTGPERRSGVRRAGAERRRYSRFRVKEHIYVNLRSDLGEEVGQLVDISKGGVALQLLATESDPAAYSNLGILASVDLATARIPFHTVAIREVKNPIPLSIAPMLRCCLQFKRLTPAQEAKIDWFIANYTVGNG